MKTPVDATPTSCRLEFPEDFRVACLIHHFRHEKLLQNFIDYVSICSSFCKPDRTSYRFATRVIFQYLELSGTPPLPMKDVANRRHSVNYFRQAARLSTDPHLTQKQKSQYCNAIIKDWYEIVKPIVVPSGQLELNEDIHLTLSRDFHLLCEIFQIQPAAILQHFVNQICLPKAKAQITLNVDGESPAMAFFFSATMGRTGMFKKSKTLPHNHLFVRYIEALQELDLRLFIERDVAEREKVYRKFYDAWYQALLSKNNS